MNVETILRGKGREVTTIGPEASIEAALADPVPGQDLSLRDPSLLAR